MPTCYPFLLYLSIITFLEIPFGRLDMKMAILLLGMILMSSLVIGTELFRFSGKVEDEDVSSSANSPSSSSSGGSYSGGYIIRQSEEVNATINKTEDAVNYSEDIVGNITEYTEEANETADEFVDETTEDIVVQKLSLLDKIWLWIKSLFAGWWAG